MDKRNDLKEKLAEAEAPQASEAEQAQASDTSAEILQLTVERDDWKNKTLMAHADMENLRKRVAQDLEKNTKFANASFAKDLLPVADNLSNALEYAKKQVQNDSDNSFFQNMIKGIELTLHELENVFHKHGITKMDSLGHTFDPNLHQVISQVEDTTKPAGTIVQEMQTGYTIGGDRVLREAIVIVTK